jgi:hypothetical protein
MTELVHTVGTERFAAAESGRNVQTASVTEWSVGIIPLGKE